jgi:hypothetical protein
VISRYIVIALAVVAAGVRAAQGAFVEATGLGALAAGLILLRLAPRQSGLKRVAYLLFFIFAVTIGMVLARQTR